MQKWCAPDGTKDSMHFAWVNKEKPVMAQWCCCGTMKQCQKVSVQPQTTLINTPNTFTYTDTIYILALWFWMHHSVWVAALTQWHRIRPLRVSSQAHAGKKNLLAMAMKPSMEHNTCELQGVSHNKSHSFLQSTSGIIIQVTIPEDFIFGLNVMSCLVAHLVSDVDVINESCTWV